MGVATLVAGVLQHYDQGTAPDSPEGLGTAALFFLPLTPLASLGTAADSPYAHLTCATSEERYLCVNPDPSLSTSLFAEHCIGRASSVVLHGSRGKGVLYRTHRGRPWVGAA